MSSDDGVPGNSKEYFDLIKQQMDVLMKNPEEMMNIMKPFMNAGAGNIENNTNESNENTVSGKAELDQRLIEMFNHQKKMMTEVLKVKARLMRVEKKLDDNMNNSDANNSEAA